MDRAIAGDAESADVKHSNATTNGNPSSTADDGTTVAPTKPKQRSRRKKADVEEEDSSKRRCVSTACIACRKRKSKCDGNTPACAACSQVYGTECIYDPNSDHRRKGVYKNDIDNLKTRNSTLQTLIQAILNYPEDDVPALVREIRTCESLDAVAEKIASKEDGAEQEQEEEDVFGAAEDDTGTRSTFESHLYGKMGDLRLDEGSVRYIGGTSNLIHLASEENEASDVDEYLQQENPITSWTNVTNDPDLVLHLVNMYFTWHYTFFTCLSKQLFFRDFSLGRPPASSRRKTHYCTPLLVNAILSLGCHFTSHAGARENPEDSATAGDHFFKEAKRLIMENDEHEKPRLTTVQALALMSVREAGCGREGRGWVYSGMSFRMACDMGLNLDSGQLTSNRYVSGDENEEDVRRVTFWGCYLFDKCWSNYLGRLPQLPSSLVTVSKYEVFPDEDSAQWSPYTDSGFTQAHAQPSRTRAVALQISKLCEISNDLMKHFYNPTDMDKTKGKAAELKKLSDIHTRLEGWRRDLPKELEPKEGGLSSVLIMHMYFQLLFIHLFRPFLKYTQATSPLPQNVSPRKLCTQAAAMISKLMRLYKRSHGLRQISNVAVYIAHSACTIHLLNLPDKNAKRDIVHGVKHLEEIAEGWLCARRTLAIISLLVRKWNVELPDEAASVLTRTDAKFGTVLGEIQSPASQTSHPRRMSEAMMQPPPMPQQQQPWQANTQGIQPNNYFTGAPARASMVSASSSAAMPSNTANYQPPPQDANGLRAQQYPSAANTPATQPRRSWASTGGSTTRQGASPSDMFGGVEQLIRDSQEWAYRDQAQLATGFDNWNQIDMDPSTWNTSPATTVGIPAPAINGGVSMGGPVGGQIPGVSIPPQTPQAGFNHTSPQSMGGLGMANWLNSMNAYNNMAGAYNEDEWYQ
ncbi:Nitrogen assimilation transcription factor nit-4 [Pseudocercospora fuligena]|uniref:Nitrogen assimilation transcription factor nit-4 n=1 Tax=Pseudocercospora fuligena TaxID=685502 RepID=A0A8H6RSP2_9PEZI|nr:Nitrogen assimilation transcription factor nit-4 [Pseudocercospora fuligena]